MSGIAHSPEPELPAYECAFCGAETDLRLSAIEMPQGEGYRYFTGYRCKDRLGCEQRQSEPEEEQANV
jgi:hypothetical protein